MASWFKRKQSIWAGKHESDQHFAITEFQFHCVTGFFFFTLSQELLNGLRSAVGLTQRIPPFGDKLRHRAWFYDLSLQHPPTLWARSEGSSVSIGRLALHLRADSHHDREIQKNIYHVFQRFDLAVEHIANFWQQVLHGMQFNIPVSKSKASIYSQLSDLPGCKYKAIIKY